MGQLLQPRTGDVPGELIDFAQWVVWKAEPKKKKDGTVKITKVPYNPKNGLKASNQKSSHWGTFDQAVKAYRSGKFDGIGFVFTKNDPFVGVDLDGCYDDNGKLTHEAKVAVATLKSYTEKSPSGKGLHIIVKANLRGPGRCDHVNGREMYQDGRFFTITGHTVKFTSVVPAQSGINVLYDEWFGINSFNDVEIGDLDWDCLADIVPVEKMPVSKQIRALVKSGKGMDDYKDHDNNPDRSLALFTVCREMVYAGVNKESILTCLTDEANYLSSAALDRRGGVESGQEWLWKYTLAKIIARYNEEADMFADVVDNDDEEEPEVDETESQDSDRGETQGEDDSDSDDDDEESGNFIKGAHEWNAALFMRRNPIVRISKQYLKFNGKCWVNRTDEQTEGDIAKAMFGMDFPISTINNTITTVRRLSVKSNFKADPNLICFPNGVLDLTGWDMGLVDLELKKHSKDFKVVGMLNFKYRPDADCPTWLAFLNSIFEGDQERIILLQQFLGYILVRDYRWQKMLLMVGKSRSGKGTITNNIVPLLVGNDCFTATSLTNLAGDHGLASLLHSKVTVISDAHHARKDRMSRSKEVLLNISSNDSVTINPKHKDEISVRLDTRLIMSCNEFPAFMDGADALSNRMMPLVFNKSFAGKEDPNLSRKLIREIAGIFNWAVKGLLHLAADGKFIVPVTSMDKQDEMKERQNPVGYFVTHFLAKAKEEARVSKNEMYDAYVSFAHAAGHKLILDKRWFGRALKDNAEWIKDGRLKVNEGRDKCYLGVKIEHSKLRDFIDEDL